MKAAVLTIHNPFDPLGSRRILPVSRRRRIRALAPRGNRPVIAMLNGRPVLRAEWRRKLADGDQLVFCVLPRDGAGNGGSNPLRVILSLAVLVFAPWAAGALLGANAATVLVGSFTLGQATTLGIALAGNAVVNALLPTRQPAQLLLTLAVLPADLGEPVHRDDPDECGVRGGSGLQRLRAGVDLLDVHTWRLIVGHLASLLRCWTNTQRRSVSRSNALHCACVEVSRTGPIGRRFPRLKPSPCFTVPPSRGGPSEHRRTQVVLNVAPPEQKPRDG